MNPVEKAIWFIEAHSDKAISLDDIASAAEVSRFHLVRAFGILHGRSVMRYLRARRLSEAARSISAGSERLIDVALDAGYQSTKPSRGPSVRRSAYRQKPCGNPACLQPLI